MPLPDSIYRHLLIVLPRELRREAEPELLATFAEARTRARSRGLMVRLMFWPRMCADLMATARAERRAGWHGSWRWNAADIALDVRSSFRNLRRSPSFAAAAILTFGLGIGVNLAVLSVIDRAMFRPLPYGDANALVHMHSLRRSSGPAPTAYLPRIVTETLRTQATSFEGIAVSLLLSSPVTLDGIANPFRFNSASINLLKVLKVSPIAGRDFAAEDIQSKAAEQPLLLTEEAWERRFNRAPGVISKSFKAGRTAYRVVGILPSGFFVPASSFDGEVDGIVAQVPNPGPLTPMELGPAAIGRLRPGVTLEQARTEVDVIMANLKQPTPSPFLGRPLDMQPLRAGLFQLYRPYVWLVFAAVAAVFLAACVNLATLFLARGRAKEHEAAVRTALGASRGQVLRSALVEAFVLCLLSSIGALLVCTVSFNGLLAIVPAAFRGIAVSPLDARLIVITLVASLATALLAGGWPALRASRVDVTEGLRRDWRSTGSRLRGGSTLLAIEAAFGVFMVAGAAMTLHSFLGLVLKNPGFAATDLYEVSVNHGYSKERFYEPLRVQRVIDTVREQPGVVAAGAASIMPVGRTQTADDEFWKTRGLEGIRLGVGSGLFAALGTPLLAGREFTDADVSSAALLAIVNRSAAAALFPSVDAGDVVGRSVDTAGGSRTVIGVVADVKPMPGLGADAALYVPVTAREVPFRQSSVTVAVRMAPGSTLDAAVLTARLNEQFSPATARASLVIDALSPNLQQPRFQALLFGSVALIGLLLAAIGLYAVTAFDVARRRAELGIRLSLGARASDLRSLVIRGALRPVLVGTSAGLIGAWWAASLLQGFVFEVNVRSPWTYAGVTLVLVITAVIAAWRPAQKAARTDPASVLRTL